MIMALKIIKSFHRDNVCTVFVLKSWETGTTNRQPGSGRCHTCTYCWKHWFSQLFSHLLYAGPSCTICQY